MRATSSMRPASLRRARLALLAGPAARLALLAGPTALAFFSGGYFDSARAWAGLAAWILVVVGLLLRPSALPRGRHGWLARGRHGWLALGRHGWLALGGLGALAGWTLFSTLWAPIAGNAWHAGQIVFLYLGALLATVLLISSPGAQRLVDPALAAGTLIVIGYGMSDRFLPGLIRFTLSVSAQGRLEQPLTYWNAMGEVAAIGLVLCARLAGDAGRAARLRMLAASAAALLGMGLYLSFSRGALFAGAAGLVTLVIAAGRREQLRAALLCVGAAAVAAAACTPFAGVTSLQGSISTREGQGAIVLALLVVVAGTAATAQWLMIRRERPAALRLPPLTPVIATAVIGAGLALAIVVGAKESGGAAKPLSSGATRLVTLQSNRYDYWRVALRAFAQAPLHGVGAGGWSVYWLRWRTVSEFAQDAHSLPVQVLAELGVVGLALLAVFLAGVGLAAARGLRRTSLAVGPLAGCVAYIAHSPLDWDWQMPAVTLIAIVLAGALLATAESPGVALREIPRGPAPAPAQ